MAEVKLRLGAKVDCSDGPAGKLTRFLIDLESGRVTHLDVAHHGSGGGHLVPTTEIAEGGDEIRLSISQNQFSSLGVDQSYVDVAPAHSYFDPDALVQMPLAGFGRFGMFGSFGGTGSRPLHETVTPRGDTGVERHAPAYASGGHHIGHVDGLIIDSTDGRITHVLLGEGHIFNKREVAIPADGVIAVDEEGARFSLTKDEIEALPNT